MRALLSFLALAWAVTPLQAQDLNALAKTIGAYFTADVTPKTYSCSCSLVWECTNDTEITGTATSNQAHTTLKLSQSKSNCMQDIDHQLIRAGNCADGKYRHNNELYSCDGQQTSTNLEAVRLRPWVCTGKCHFHFYDPGYVAQYRARYNRPSKSEWRDYEWSFYYATEAAGTEDLQTSCDNVCADSPRYGTYQYTQCEMILPSPPCRRRQE